MGCIGCLFCCYIRTVVALEERFVHKFGKNMYSLIRIYSYKAI